MKRAGKPAGHDFGDNRVPGAGQRVRECLTERPELDNQGALIMTHRHRAGDPPGRREAAGDAGASSRLSDARTDSPTAGSPARPEAASQGFRTSHNFQMGRAASDVPHRCATRS